MAIHPEDIRALDAGDYIHDDGGDFRIMAKAEGYLMMRRTGCIPFVAAIEDLSAHDCFKGFGELRLGRSPKSKPPRSLNAPSDGDSNG